MLRVIVTRPNVDQQLTIRRSSSPDMLELVATRNMQSSIPAIMNCREHEWELLDVFWSHLKA
jgi:hypothetical protein